MGTYGDEDGCVLVCGAGRGGMLGGICAWVGVVGVGSCVDMYAGGDGATRGGGDPLETCDRLGKQPSYDMSSFERASREDLRRLRDVVTVWYVRGGWV